MVISDFFNEKVEFFHDRRSTCGGYYFDVLLSPDRLSNIPAGINRFFLDTFEDAVKLQHVFLELHRCYLGQISHPLPCNDIQLTLSFD